MTVNRSGIRELQIARGLITLRWASIPVIFGFSALSLNYLGMSFKIEPIYLLCCLLAILNVFFTLHFSLLSRQLMLSHGITSLKKLLLKVVSGFFSSVGNRGIRRIAGLPVTITKIFAIMYLMMLETLKQVSFNPLSVNNVMHSQVISDLSVIVLLTRFTGTTESPLLILAVVPITVAGAVMGFKTGLIYTGLATGSWVITSLLVKFQFIPHIKFYPPMYGDLSQYNGWISANAIVVSTALGGAAFLAHRLTTVFKERIFFLNDMLYKSNNRSVAAAIASENSSGAWMITDAEGNIEKIKVDRNGIFKADMVDKNLLKSFPELEQYGIAYVIQAVMTSGSRRNLEKIRLASSEGTEHIFNARLISFKDCDNQMKILAFFEEKTEELFFKGQVDHLKKEFNELSLNFERLTLENKDNRRAYEEVHKALGEKSVEIEILQQKLRTLKIEETNQSNQVASLMLELANLKSANDQLSSDLQYRQMLLDEVAELLDSCNELESLTSRIEKKTRELFNLDNACLHVFKAEDNDQRRGEILDIRKASPRLLDIPRSNPEALDPVLNEGRPVIINAQITPEKAASVALTNGPMQRLTAYIPVRHQGKILGMMMLEKYGYEENSEVLINTISYYLRNTAAIIRNAIATRESQCKNDRLHKNLTRLYTQLDSIKSIVFSRPDEDSQLFAKVLNEITKIVAIRDAMLVRCHNDGTHDILSRVDRSRQLKLSAAEETIIQTIKSNPRHKATLEISEEDEGMIAFPLNHNNRLVGILFVSYSTDTGAPDEVITDFCVKLLKDQLALHVMNEEKELWESFYSKNLLA